MKQLLLLILLIPLVHFSQIQIGQTIYGNNEEELFGVSLDISGNGSFVVIANPRNDDNGINSGQVLVYERINNSWVQVGQPINGVEGDFSSFVTISFDGNIVAVGSPFSDVNGFSSGVVRVYQNQGGNWTQIGQDIVGENSGDLAGDVSISNDGSVLAVGAEENSDNGFDSGHVRIFRFENNNWVQIGQDLDGDSAGDQFSIMSLSGDGNVVAIGSEFGDTDLEDAGYVKVFENQNDNWVQIGEVIEGDSQDDQLGISSISEDGSVLAISALNGGNNVINPGYVKVFELQNNSWIQIGQTIYGDANGDVFAGISLSSNGNILSIGAPYGDINGQDSGYVRVYENINNNWIQIGQDILGDSPGNNFGLTSISSNGEVLAISGNGDTVNGMGTGILKVFSLSQLLSTDLQSISDFKLYPNPTKNKFTIQLDNPSELKNVNIYNNLGQLVLTSIETIIDTSKLASGLYTVEVETTKGKGTKKLIIE